MPLRTSPDLASGSIPRVIPKATAAASGTAQPSRQFRKTHNWSSCIPGAERPSETHSDQRVRAPSEQSSRTPGYDGRAFDTSRRSGEDPPFQCGLFQRENGHLRVTVDRPKHGVSVTAVAHRFTTNPDPEPRIPGESPRFPSRIAPVPTADEGTPTRMSARPIPSEPVPRNRCLTTSTSQPAPRGQRLSTSTFPRAPFLECVPPNSCPQRVPAHESLPTSARPPRKPTNGRPLTWPPADARPPDAA